MRRAELARVPDESQESYAYTDKEAHIKKLPQERCSNGVWYRVRSVAEFWLRWCGVVPFQHRRHGCFSGRDARGDRVFTAAARRLSRSRRVVRIGGPPSTTPRRLRGRGRRRRRGGPQGLRRGLGGELRAARRRRRRRGLREGARKRRGAGADARAPRALPLRRPQRRRGGAGRSRSSSGSGAGARRALAGARARRGAPRRGRQGDGRLRARRRVYDRALGPESTVPVQERGPLWQDKAVADTRGQRPSLRLARRRPAATHPSRNAGLRADVEGCHCALLAHLPPKRKRDAAPDFKRPSRRYASRARVASSPTRTACIGRPGGWIVTVFQTHFFTGETRRRDAAVDAPSGSRLARPTE